MSLHSSLLGHCSEVPHPDSSDKEKGCFLVASLWDVSVGFPLCAGGGLKLSSVPFEVLEFGV